MGKIVKYCSSCDEGFAERFAFCPDCGASLQAFEMNPVEGMQTKASASLDEEVRTSPSAVEALEPAAPAFIADSVPARSDKPTEEEIEFAEAPTEEIPAIIDEPAEEIARPAAPVFYQSKPLVADEPRKTYSQPNYSKGDDGYHVTVIQEKNVGQRNMLLLGATAFMLSVVMVAWAVSLFGKDLDVGAIGDERSLAYLGVDVPLTVEEEEQKKNDDEGGGGGGGGREDEIEESQGDLANQTKNPQRAPDAKTYRSDNFELKMPPASTQGDRQFEQKYDRYGNPDKFGQIASNGMGTGGGIGSGTGTGQGSGSGTGTGSGTGSGSGSGNGNGNGGGTGDGDGFTPPVVKKVTTEFKLLSKQKAQYTDAARTNNVQGTVTLRVTFLGTGQIGSISVISGLPHGLTEQAIAAARRMTFQPKTINGQPQTTSRPVSFTFNIY